MARYVVAGNQSTVSSSYKTGTAVYAAASVSIRRGKIFRIAVGQSSAPNATDVNVQFDLSRQTAAGTATAFTPNPEDPADAACSAVAGINATVEGTITSNSSLFNRSINQRGTLSWETDNEAAMHTWPATASNGFALRAQSSVYAGAVTTELGFLE